MYTLPRFLISVMKHTRILLATVQEENRAGFISSYKRIESSAINLTQAQSANLILQVQ